MALVAPDFVRVLPSAPALVLLAARRRAPHGLVLAQEPDVCLLLPSATTISVLAPRKSAWILSLAAGTHRL